jgi:tetratricopeptide (TPR) repeat protein
MVRGARVVWLSTSLAALLLAASGSAYSVSPAGLLSVTAQPSSYQLLVTCYIPLQSTESNAGMRARIHWEQGYALGQQGDLLGAEKELRRAVALAPDNTAYVHALGTIVARLGKLQDAASLFRQARTLAPADLQIRQDLAAAEWQIGELRDAATNLDFILRRQPRNETASLMLGMVLENEGKYSRAIPYLVSAHTKLEQHPEALAALLHCYYKTSRQLEAHNLEKPILNAPTRMTAAFLAAAVAEDARDYEFASKLLISVHNADPSSAEVDYQLALLGYRMGNYSEATETLKRLITQDSRRGRYFNLLGWCLAKQQRTSEAVKSFDRAIDLDPQKVSNYVDVGTVLGAAGLLPAALQAANRAVQIDPKSYDAYHLKGLIQMKQHNYVAAVESYKRAAVLNDRDPGALIDLGNAEGASGQFETASLTFEKAIKKYPRHTELYYQYALLTLHHSGSDTPASQDKATALLRKALNLDDSFAGAHYELGNISLARGQYSQALVELRKAARLAPSDRDTHYALWVVLRKLGRTQEAANELRLFKSTEGDERRQQ